MIRKVMFVFLGGIVALVATLFVSSRSVWDAARYLRATADETVDTLTEQLPTAIRDRRVENDLQGAKNELVDHQTALNLSRNQLGQLQDEIDTLQTSIAGRERLLAEAYVTLKEAVEDRESTIRFASMDFGLSEFEAEIDDLLAEQDRENRQLEIKREGLTRIESNLGEGEEAIADMREALKGVEQEVAVLKTRREQAEIEASTLDLVSSVTDGHRTATSSVGDSVNRMKTQIEELEARNEARQTLAPERKPSDNQLSHAWSRLERLKSFHDQHVACKQQDNR